MSSKPKKEVLLSKAKEPEIIEESPQQVSSIEDFKLLGRIGKF